ncbi:MAG: CRISPR-associated helicase Cas3' [Brooklawnia sp.]|jgi:CRISPR-associated endonuclease/helicase Cas3
MWAHSKNVVGKRHLLSDHLRGTAELAKGFGEAFGAAELCYGAGLAHDVGKCIGPWQDYLLLREAKVPAAGVDHKTAGAWLFSDVAGAPGLLALLGHHSGMPDQTVSDRGKRPDAEALGMVRDLVRDAVLELEQLLGGQSLIPPYWSGKELEALEMRVRMLHSSLVDADFLDTEAHFNAEPVRVRDPADFGQLFDRFLTNREGFLRTRPAARVDAIRESVFEESLNAAADEPGIYRLPGPTGSGKTISSTAFALRHAALHGKSRVVIAVPFLAITTQNAQVVRSLVDPDQVIEQHSAIDAKERSKLGAENWDAPVVVTTTVQLFESLLSNSPSKCRKLHNLVNSVLVLDEVQAIPVRVLPVVLDVLRILVKYFGVTVLLSSATQPAWDQLSAWRDDQEIAVRDVVADPSALYASLRRTETSWLEVSTPTEFARLIRHEKTALVIVNKTGQARDLARLLAEESPHQVLHLSTRMYAAHRAKILEQARDLLARGEPFVLVSTQLVEAGVDLDFPVVFRVMAPAENLLQAAGRCNREGALQSGRLVVVDCSEWTPLRDYETGIAKTVQHFKRQAVDLDDPEAMDAYFADYYETAAVDRQVQATKINSDRRQLYMRSVARAFRMIEDDSLTVVVAQAPGAEELLADFRQVQARGGAPGPERWRRLQQFCVSIPAYLASRVSLTEELPGVLVSRACYDWLVGIDVDAQSPNDSIF